MPSPADPVVKTAEDNDKAAGGKNFFSRKYGPLPGWGWSLLAGGGAIAYFWWRSRKQATSALTGTGTSSTGTGYAGDISALQAEIDALQNGVTSTGSTGSGSGSGGGGTSTTTGTTGGGGGTSTTTGTTGGGGGSGSGGTKKKETFYRHVATGTLSLNAVAKTRRTTAAHIIGTTRSSHGTGHGINAKNLAKFNHYVSKGTGKKMPTGLIYYTSNK